MFNSKTFRCIPLPGYFDAAVTIAVKCPNGCQICSSSTKCIQCFSGNYLMLTDYQCYLKCPNRYYINYQALTCQSCSYDCFTCKMTGVCETCNKTTDFRQLSNVTLRCIPIAGYYDVGKTISVKCPTGCSMCLSATKCTVCETGYFLTNQKCALSCPDRYFMDRVTQSCQSCPYTCLNCDKNRGCITCSLVSDFRILSTSNKIPTCTPILGYFDRLNSVSVKCPNGCLSCISQTRCTACESGYFLSANYLCYNSCPPRFF